MSRPSDFVTEVRQANAALIDALEQLNALRAEWTALDYLNTLTDAGGFEGANSDTNVDEVAAVIGTTLDALNGLMAQGHSTNLFTLL